VSGKLVAGTLILVGFVVIFTVLYVVARRQSRGMGPGMPDRVSGEVVTGLMAELRKSHAETAHWKAAAERLQRELDGRS
jgi:hypothetical protein